MWDDQPPMDPLQMFDAERAKERQEFQKRQQFVFERVQKGLEEGGRGYMDRQFLTRWFAEQGVDKSRRDVKVAIKVEIESASFEQIVKDTDVLREMDGETGFPTLYWWGEVDGMRVAIMDRIGNSIYQLLMRTEKPTDPPIQLPGVQAAEIGLKAIKVLRTLHKHSFIHSDLKPENWLIEGRGSTKLPTGIKTAEPFKLCLADFGLTRRFRDESGKLLPTMRRDRDESGKRKKPAPLGTCRYVSLGVHGGFEPRRRDDLEGLIYILIEMVVGKLPWTGIKGFNTLDGWNKVRSKKRAAWSEEFEKIVGLSVDEIDQLARQEQIDEELKRRRKEEVNSGKGGDDSTGGWDVPDDWEKNWDAYELSPPPLEFIRCLSYLRELQANAEPSYDILERLLRNYLKRMLDWDPRSVIDDGWASNIGQWASGGDSWASGSSRGQEASRDSWGSGHQRQSWGSPSRGHKREASSSKGSKRGSWGGGQKSKAAKIASDTWKPDPSGW